MAEQAGSEKSGNGPHWWRKFHDKFVVEERYMEPGARRALYRTAVILMGVGTLLFIIALVGVVQSGTAPWGPDEPIREWLLGIRSETLTGVMIFLAVIFGPIALPIIVLVVTVAWGFAAKHAWRPIVLAAAMLTGVIVSQIILQIIRRSRPPVELMLFGADHTFSFPSGHVLGACDFLLVGTFLIFSRRENPRSAVLGFVGAGIGIVLAIAEPALPRLPLVQRRLCFTVPVARHPGRLHRAGHLADRPDPRRTDHGRALQSGRSGRLTAMANEPDVRRICLALPGVTERSSWGQPAWFAKT